MAADTQNKRRSILGYTLNPIYPVPDGVMDVQDRPHVAWLYSGLVASEAAPSSGGGGDVLIYERWLVDYPRLERESDRLAWQAERMKRILLLVALDSLPGVDGLP